jgi:metal-responsive CopG/Arc/MetJ family transcriptional regulator
MKIAVSIPDDLFQEAEKVAQDQQLSRSALYAKALREHLERLKDEAISAQINASIAEFGQPEADPAFLNHMRRQFETRRSLVG